MKNKETSSAPTYTLRIWTHHLSRGSLSLRDPNKRALRGLLVDYLLNAPQSGLSLLSGQVAERGRSTGGAAWVGGGLLGKGLVGAPATVDGDSSQSSGGLGW